MSDEINYESVVDEAVAEITESETPAVEMNPALPSIPLGDVQWDELNTDQKLDILFTMVHNIGAQVSWIGSTFQGLINMVGKVGPMDIFKMMRGGK